jgi:hypothetical protein
MSQKYAVRITTVVVCRDEEHAMRVASFTLAKLDSLPLPGPTSVEVVVADVPEPEGAPTPSPVSGGGGKTWC